MRTLQQSLAGTVILVLLGGLGGAAVARSEAEAPGSDESALLSFTLPYQGLTKSPTVLSDDGLTLRQRLSFRGAIDSGDPRLSGKLWAILDHDTYSDSRGSVFVGIVGIDSDDGVWRGTSRGYGTPDNERIYDQVLLSGEDAYEGLSAMLFLLDNGTAWDVVGMVYPGELPPMPGPAAE